MRGHIYSDERCALCGGRFVHDERRRGLFCPEHPEQSARRRFRVKFGRQATKRFGSYSEAERFLDGLRWEVDKGTFDARDYQRDNPLGFSSLASKWLQIKEKEVKQKSYNNLRNYMNRGIETWGQTNIKVIDYGEIEDFLYAQDVSDKTRSNMRSCLHDFWTWLRKRRVLQANQVPEFPEISFELGWRRVVDKETQQSVIDEVYRISYHLNPKIWLGIKWLSTYFSIRPGELIVLREKDIDAESGYFSVLRTKEKKPKMVPMLEEDVELIKSLPKGFPDLPFFRHVSRIAGCVPGQPFGEKYFYKWWKKACSNLGIEGVDLYGGTRHSTAMALRQLATPEQIKRASMHSTNKAFERYFRIESDEVRDIYRLARGGQHVANQKPSLETSNILKFKK